MIQPVSVSRGLFGGTRNSQKSADRTLLPETAFRIYLGAESGLPLAGLPQPLFAYLREWCEIAQWPSILLVSARWWVSSCKYTSKVTETRETEVRPSWNPTNCEGNRAYTAQSWYMIRHNDAEQRERKTWWSSAVLYHLSFTISNFSCLSARLFARGTPVLRQWWIFMYCSFHRTKKPHLS